MKFKYFLLLTIFTLLIFSPFSANAQRSTVAVNYGTTLPATCATGVKTSSLFYKTNDGLYYCSATNTWTRFTTTTGGGSGGEASIADSADYTTLESAVSGIGAAKATLALTSTLTCTTAVTIPATLQIEGFGGVITKGTGCSISFAGAGLKRPASENVIFSGFAPGNITFTGTVYPKEISTGIFDNANASVRINIADQAFLGKKVKISATPGNLGTRVFVNEGHELYLQAGTFTNNYGEDWQSTFRVFSNTWIHGAGMGLTVVFESSAPTISSMQLFYGANVDDRFSGNPALELNENITISDMTIKGQPANPFTQNDSAIFLGNVRNGRIERIHFNNVHGFAAYVGVNSTTGKYAINCYIVDNIFENVGTQNAGSINSDGLIISRNQFIHNGLEAYTGDVTYGNFIDLEPNVAEGRMRNVTISHNTFNGILAPGGTTRQYNGIITQTGGVDRLRNIVIENNSIIGAEPGGSAGISIGILGANLEDSHIRNNFITGTASTAILIYNSSKVHITGNTMTQVGCVPCGTTMMRFEGLNDSIIRNNNNIIRNNYVRGTNTFQRDVDNADSRDLVEVGYANPVNVSTTGGVTTLSITGGGASGFFPFYIGRKVRLSGGVAGVTDGLYTIATTTPATNVTNSSATLTTTAGNGNGVTATSEFSNNNYIDNLNFNYTFKTDSLSKVSDSVRNPPVAFYNVLAQGNLDTAYTLGDINPTSGGVITITSLNAYAKTAPVGCTTNAVIQVIGSTNSTGGTDSVNLTITGATNTVSAAALNKVFTENVGSVLVKVLTPAAGCTTFPSNYNVSVGYKMGVSVIYQ